MTIEHLRNEYEQYHEASLFGRYINSDHIKNLIEKHSNNFDVSVLGKSVLEEEIHFIKVGSGRKKILMWSQMHGNESTTTKAVFDLLNVLAESKNDTMKSLLGKCTIGIIPMLNPDGSRAYSRLNANQVDLNRDAQNLSQPESRILRHCFEEFKPDFCFNLHGQRTIFSAGATSKPATVSFLSPAQDVMCSVTNTRKMAMDVIVKMNQNLQRQIPGQVGIYDDAFNINCVGDTFQALNVPTILFEAGHYHDDYDREKVRELIFQSLWVGMAEIIFGDPQGSKENAYFEIPQNDKLFYDIIIRKVKLERGDVHQILDIAVQYEEKLQQNQIVFIPKIEKISDLSGFFGHREIDAHKQLVFVEDNKVLNEGLAIDFVLINGKKHTLFV
ncbi:peptidase M14 [Gelidibacter gilvus]|uniref:Peptidase M14 n=2 Tax=Gelidibacter gilvus TaxID=59602 RepID=A0A4Q0XDG5_9FLAO|nr:peptidase M14 [Gelidibacter gilvus]